MQGSKRQVLVNMIKTFLCVFESKLPVASDKNTTQIHLRKMGIYAHGTERLLTTDMAGCRYLFSSGTSLFTSQFSFLFVGSILRDVLPSWWKYEHQLL